MTADDDAPDSPGGLISPTRCGFVAIVGAPNVGKSTLVNSLVGSKVSIVSPKAQTTRTRVRGIMISGDSQVIMVDTPGLFAPKRGLDRAMLVAAWRSLDDADEIMLVVDAAKGRDDAALQVIERLRRGYRQACVVLNKVDAVRKAALLPLAQAFSASGAISQVFMVSALSGDGVADVREYLAAAVPAGPWLYPPDQVTDTPEALQAAEMTREQVFLQLHEEVPRSTAVVPESWQERADGSLRIEQNIYVERDSQRPIVIGEDGQRIRRIGEASRRELERLFECRIHLFLQVRVRERWPDGREAYAWHHLETPGKV